jgi:hypothetical protein
MIVRRVKAGLEGVFGSSGQALKSYYTTRCAERWCRWQRAGLDGLVSLNRRLKSMPLIAKLETSPRPIRRRVI